MYPYTRDINIVVESIIHIWMLSTPVMKGVVEYPTPILQTIFITMIVK